MRQGQHKGRQRGRGQRRQGGGGNSPNRVFESNGPDVKVRGTAQTVADKYLQLARDSVSAGDSVSAESYYQHAEHYLRLIAATQSQQQQNQQQQQQQNNPGPASGGDNAERNAEQPEAAMRNGANDVPGSGPQPGLTETAAVEEKTEVADSGSFDGQAPDFLAKPAETEKPKRSRRPSSRTKSAKAKVEVADAAEATDASDAAAENVTAASSDAEVAAG